MKSVDGKFLHDLTCRAFVWASKNLPDWALYFVDWAAYLKKFALRIPDIAPEQCANLEGDKSLDFEVGSFSEKKLPGVTGVMRIRNGDDFMEPVMESHLELCDEIIVLENQSDDRTAEIGKAMAAKYPDRVRYFEWNHPIHRCFTKEFEECPGNSVHSFGHYSTFGIAQARYEYVMKVDDDDLWIPEKAREVRKMILERRPRRAIYYYGLNLAERDGELGVPKANPYLGKVSGDHLIYPISAKTYCLQSYGAEVYTQPYRWLRYGLGVLHLKHLKKDYGFTNYPEPKHTKALEGLLAGGMDRDFEKYAPSLDVSIVKATLARFGVAPKTR